ncbi:MAG TPA: alpha/beta fold hydrolase [Sphingomonas sp.]|uniref:S9 family peptidase n=1 Tax=Sphingomonas sp. TaxID=28214 RepID=UPI002CB4140E|nr:alpha/beta fold hydrolase [Sphingomonas sp.]HMI21173.1 alpha/beta fold hydrolase [Sphingomonas sp.]
MQSNFLTLALYALLGGVSVAAMAAEPAPMSREQAAKMFGARPAIFQMSLSPDGKRIAYVGAAAGQASVVMVGDLVKGELTPITYSDNKPQNLYSCGWSDVDRLVCTTYGQALINNYRLSFTRLFAVDADGKNIRALGAFVPSNPRRLNQYDGEVIDWLDVKGRILISRDHIQGETTGTMVAGSVDGIGVDLVDTRTNVARSVERARANASSFITDGKGNVRIMGLRRMDATGYQITGEQAFQYRARTGGPWAPLGVYDEVADRGTWPLAVDPVSNSVYALKQKDGRDALYRIALDGSLREDLVLDNPRVDIDNVLVLNQRVIGAHYTADRRVGVYFDPTYQHLVEQIGRVLPKLPLIDIVDGTPDESKLLIRASSDTDEGRFYIYEKSTHALQQLMSVRPQAEGHNLAAVRSITYKTFDGVDVPAYLTLPPGSSGKNLPAIVMPHGGPGSRDVWGFDWLAQFFAARGFAVIQPEFRGSTGFGENWFVNNGFKSWKTAIGDVNAAGRWLVAQGIADPAHLGIFGWSYGGYAALQSNVLDPDLFKAVVAVAPVTDLYMLRHQSEGFTNENVSKKFIGNAELDAASPARNAAAFKAPVLMFHGTNDLNVGFAESEAMDNALRRAGKQSELVRYPGLDHQLPDSAVRADMLGKADAFLRKSMGMPDS